MDDIFTYAKWITTRDFQKETGNVIFPAEIQNSFVPDQSKINRHTVFYNNFYFQKNQERVIIKISADDYYKFSLNGKTIGQGPAQGYTFAYYYNEYDITDFLIEGENLFSCEVYYHGEICRAYNSADGRMGLIAEILQGNKCLLATDAFWKYCENKRDKSKNFIGAKTQFTEDIDFRIPFSTSQKCIYPEYDYVFNKNKVTPLTRYEKFPKIKRIISEREIFYDFGEEITASLLFKAKGKLSDEIIILSGEETNGTDVRYKMRCNCEYKDRIVLSDQEINYEQFDYKGFRFVKVILPENIEKFELSAIVRHYPFDESYCQLESDNNNLAEIFNLCKNSVKYGSQEVFVDCPTREKAQYSGDLLITGTANMILTGKGELFRKAIENQMQSVKFSDTLLSVAPGSLWQEIADYSFLFPLLSLECYNIFKDKAFLKENFDVCIKMISGFNKYSREDGLLCNVNDKWNLVDWPANLRDDYDFSLEPLSKKPHNVLNAFYIGSIIKTFEIANILEVCCPFNANGLINSFNNAFYDEKNKMYLDCEDTDHSSLHSNVLPVYFGFNKPESAENIHNMIMQKQLCCGVYMSYFVLKALCSLGFPDDALKLILSDSEHSWNQMLREGATTCFEAWGKEQKHNTSLCHPWACAPIIILAQDILKEDNSIGKLLRKGDIK